MSAMKQNQRIFFDAIIFPHRSLTPQIARNILLVVAGLLFVVGLIFLSMGAWPVLGFLGLEVLVLGLAFKFSFLQARAKERILLTTDELTIEKISAKGKCRSWHFQPYWISIDVIDQDYGRKGEIALRSHGQEVRIAHWLSDEERYDFVRELRASLKRSRLA
jgi:uncharacterized membrane protein